MPEKKRVARATEKVSRGFDDQFWPIVLALCVLAGFLVGVIITVFRFNDGRITHNAWTYLVPLPLLLAGAIWALSRVRNQIVRRGLQLSIVLSLLLHVVFLVVSTRVYWTRWLEYAMQSPQDVPEQTEVIIPDYNEVFLESRKQPKPDFEKPVETEATQPDQPDVQRLRVEPEQPREHQQTVPVPRTEQTPDPQTIKRRTPRETTPRSSETASRLARNESKARPQLDNEAVDAPRLRPKRRRQVDPLEAAAASDRAANAIAPSARMAEVSPEPQSSVTPEPSAAPRRPEDARAVADRASTPTLPRPVRRPTMTPRSVATAADNAPRVEPRRTGRETPQPEQSAMGRRATTAPESGREVPTIAPEIPASPSRRMLTQQQPSETAPTLARTNRLAPGTRSRLQTRPSTARVSADAIATTAPEQQAPNRELAPSTSSISRRSSDTRSESSSIPLSGPSANTAVAGASAMRVDRAARSDTPTLDPTARPSRRPNRAGLAAHVPASPTVADTPAADVSQRPTSNPGLEPARAVMARATSGTAGVGRSPNFGRDMPAGRAPSLVASAAGLRSRATQRDDTGPSMSPSMPARSARMRAGAQLPRATLLADSADNATAPGARVVSDFNADASASLKRSSSNALPGTVNAPKGMSHVDMGIDQIVKNTRSGRSAGGGQPELNLQTRSRREFRSRSGGMPRPALAVTAQAETPAAPTGTGGGQPEAALDAPTSSSFVAKADNKAFEMSGGGPDTPAEPGADLVAGKFDQADAVRIGRAEMADAAGGQPQPGGGTTRPRRTATGRSPRIAMQAEVITSAGVPDPGTAPGGPAIEASGSRDVRATAGIEGPVASEPAGAVGGDTIVDALATVAPDVRAIGRAASEATNGSGPMINTGRTTGNTKRRRASRGVRATTTLAVNADLPESPSIENARSPGGGAESDLADLVGDPGALEVARADNGGILTSVNAPEGPGGIGVDEPAVNAGIISRHARPDSQEVHLRMVRFQRRQPGGEVAINVTAATGTDAFRSRKDRPADGGALENSVPPQTEEAIERGVSWMIRQQRPDGSWSLGDHARQGSGYEYERPIMKSDTAATGLALLSLLGAGYHHKEGRYKDQVTSGLTYLVKNQKKDGNLFNEDIKSSIDCMNFYSHSIATIALCEAYGMTQDPWLRDPAVKAIKYLEETQHKDLGGWRYTPGRNTDTSVTGWCMMALKSGELAGLEVNPQCYRKIAMWLDNARTSDDEPFTFRYNPYAPKEAIVVDQATQLSAVHGRVASRPMTSVGLLMRMYLGWSRSKEQMRQGADFLLESLPATGDQRDRTRDTYYWYYGTQVMYHMGGDYWQKWNERLHPLLLQTQDKEGPMAGSWNPVRPVPDRWGPHAGRLYVTALNILSLEVYYRHLPIYEETAR